MISESNEDSDEWEEKPKRRIITSRTKRRKTSTHIKSEDLLSPVLDLLPESREGGLFENIVSELLPEFLQARAALQERETERDIDGVSVRPLTRSEETNIIDELATKEMSGSSTSPTEKLTARKLKLQKARRRSGFSSFGREQASSSSVTPLPIPQSTSSANQQVIDALYAIRTTPYESSFLSRLHGVRPSKSPLLIAVDWETRSPWMDLMDDIRDHHRLAHPEREQSVEARAPIEYVTLQPHHLGQVHDLLSRVFWPGIDVSDSLQYSPELCTVIAMYKKLVVGVAFLSSPQETYITYLAVKAGWENAQIATSMLYYIITVNPNKDITLHVSTNNPAMLLYNRFGFKAEEFVAGFYDAYMDPKSRASKNAFRLRLRR